MKFVGWLVYFVLGSVIFYFICTFIENGAGVDNWSAFMRGLFIFGVIAWGAFLAWWVNTD